MMAGDPHTGSPVISSILSLWDVINCEQIGVLWLLIVGSWTGFSRGLFQSNGPNLPIILLSACSDIPGQRQRKNSAS